MVKIIFAIVVVGILYVFYADGLKPYFDALAETNRLLTKAGIPLEQSTNTNNKEKTVKILTAECTHGVVQSDVHIVRCASDARFSTFK